MAITDLTGTTWTFNDSIDVGAENNSYHITFTSNGEDFTGVRRYGLDQAYPNELWFLYSAGGGVIGSKYVYEDGWSMPQYKTIYISGGTDATNATLISWIEANATQYIEPHDIIISYNGNTITMDDSGTEVLDTKGHWLPDDITVEYTKSGGVVQSMLVEVTRNAAVGGRYIHQIEMTAGNIKSALDQGISFVFWYPCNNRYYSLEYASIMSSGTYVNGVKLTGLSTTFSAESESSKPQYVESGGAGGN